MPTFKHLTASLVVHSLVVALLFVGLNNMHAQTQTATQASAEVTGGVLVVDETHDEADEEPPQTKPAPAKQLEDDGQRRQYAGALQSSAPDPVPSPAKEPPAAKKNELQQAELTQPRDRSGQGAQPVVESAESSRPSSSRDPQSASEWRQVAATSSAAEDSELAASDRDTPDGFIAPGFQFGDANIHRLDAIVAARHGVYVVFLDDGSMFAVTGTLKDVTGVSPVQASQLGRLSRRTVEVSNVHCHRIHDALQAEFGLQGDKLNTMHTRLLLVNSLDSLILSRQQEAARMAGLPLDRLRLTIGSLEFRQGQPSDFAINRIVLHDGRTLSANTKP